MATFIAINGVDGSNVTFDFDGSTTITLTAHSAAGPGPLIAAADCTWSLLDAPAGSGFDSAWWGPANIPGWPNVNTIPAAVPSFIPDKEGTWLFRCANADGTADQVVVGVRSNRSDIRIPAAGETNEADANRGWAVDRDEGLYTFDELITAGGIQVCKLAPAMAAVDAGALLSYTGIDDVNPITGESIPRVDLASTNTNPNYAGVLKGDIDGSTAGIAAESYVWVSRSGIVTGGAVGTLDLSTFTVGDIVYLDTAANAGDPFRDTDSFASAVAAFPDVMIPAGIVVDNANPGKILVAPGLKYTGAAAVNATFRYKGIGDFSSLRVGRSDGLTIAGEEDGTIETIATAQENIAQGNVVCISSLGAYIADSSRSMRTAPFQLYRQDGIFGIAVEAVLSGQLGHFTIFGPVPNALITGTLVQGDVYYVGSSTASSASAGTLVKKGILEDPTNSLNAQYPISVHSAPNTMVPVGVYENGDIQMGTIKDDGLINKVQSTQYYQDGENVTWNANILSVDNANVYHPADVTVSNGLANVNLPDTITDVSADPSSLYEAPIMADSLYDIANDQLGGNSFPGGMDTPGAPLEKAVGTGWDPSALANTVELFGSFAVDNRYRNGTNPVKIVVYGYTNNSAVGNIEVDLMVRFNACGQAIDAATTTLYAPTHFSTAAGTQTAVCLEYPLYEESGGNPANFIGVLNQISGADISSVDFSMERQDVIDTGFIVTKVVLVSTYSSISRFESEPYGEYEHQVPGPALYDSFTNAPRVSNQAIGTDNAVGFSMSDAVASGTGFATGFVPLDDRASVFDMNVRVTGQYKGNIPAATIDLELSVRLEYCGNNYPVLLGAGDFQSSVSLTPAHNTLFPATTYDELCFDFTIPQAVFAFSGIYGPAGMPVLHYTLIRRGVNPDPVELFFHITNIQFTQSNSGEDNDETYENHLPSVFSINGVSGNYNYTTAGDALDDYGGFRMPSGGTETLLAAVNFDARYNERDSIEVTVIGGISSAGADVTLDFSWESLYCSGSVPALASYQPRKRGEVDTAAYAADVHITCHTFYLSAHEVWGDNGIPSGAPIDHNTLMLKVSRADASGNLYTVLAISARSDSSKRFKPFDGFINISEDRTTPDRSRLLIPGGSRHDLTKDILLSTQRYTWTYGLDGSVEVLPAASTALQPAGIPSGSATTSNDKPGYLIPYNVAIVGVFGWLENEIAAGDALTDATIKLSLYDVPNKNAGVVSRDNEEGVYHFPLTVTIDDSDNSFRWTGNELNLEATDTHNLPLVYLPSDYSGGVGAFVRWLLTVEFHNDHAGNTYWPLGNVMVEVALLPTAE
jgi:hypothetical protein